MCHVCFEAARDGVVSLRVVIPIFVKIRQRSKYIEPDLCLFYFRQSNEQDYKSCYVIPCQQWLQVCCHWQPGPMVICAIELQVS